MNPLDLGIARQAHRLLQQADQAMELMTRSEKHVLSLVGIVEGLKSGHGVTGFNRECLSERARIQGTDFDPTAPILPWSILATETRAPLAANLGATGGGYLLSNQAEPSVIDVLRPYALAMQCGATVYDHLVNNAIFPKLAADVSGQWLSDETIAITEQPPVFAGAPVTPRNWGFVARWSRQLEQQAPNLEAFLRTIAARAAGLALDTAALTGIGSGGVPLGLLNQTGIGAQSGTAYSHAASLATRETLADLNVDDASVSWLANPGVRTILAARERAAGASFIWDKDQVTDRVARVSSIVPAATLIAGDFSSLAFCFFGDGFQIDSTQFHSAVDFKTGISAMRLMVSVDIFLQHAPSFVAITAIT